MSNIKIFKKHDVTCANDAEALVKEMNAGWEIHERFNGWVILSSPKSEETQESTPADRPETWRPTNSLLEQAWEDGRLWGNANPRQEAALVESAWNRFVEKLPADPLDEYRNRLHTLLKMGVTYNNNESTLHFSKSGMYTSDVLNLLQRIAGMGVQS